MANLKFTKHEAARRQLELAVRLYFNDSDPVSTHTLAGAANELLRDLAKHSGQSPLLKDQALEIVRPEHRKAVAAKLQEAQNFFKHADRDPDGVLSFDPGQTELMLLDSCWAYRRLVGERLPVLQTFELWSACTWAQEFIAYPGWEDTLELARRQVPTMSKAAFFDRFVAIGQSADLRSDA